MTAVDGVGRRTVLASAMALVGVACATRARAEIDLADLTVVNRDTGQTMPVWRRGDRLFVAGEQGQRYSLRLTNRTEGRVLVVLSVDGVNVISGETAQYGQRGYVLGPYESYDINGWRKSTSEIAAFAFTALPNSYAAETGRPGNVGVIGMAVFRERPRPAITPLEASPAPPPPPPPAPAARSSLGAARQPAPIQPRAPIAPPPDTAPPPPLALPPVQEPIRAPPPAAAAKSAESVVVTGSRIQRRDYSSSPPSVAQNEAARDAKLGTAHGDLERSFINIVSFDRLTPYPQLIRQIEYDSYANLVAAGVIPRPRPEHPPRAFPFQRGAPGFTPDPPARP